MKTRLATDADAAAIAAIYNEGIQDGIATFETRLRTADDVRTWIGGRFPVVVVEDGRGDVIAFASTSEYRPRECYAGVAEFSVYVARSARRLGAGRLAMERLIEESRQAGFWKLVSRVFVENSASRALSATGLPRSRHLRASREAPRHLARHRHRRASHL